MPRRLPAAVLTASLPLLLLSGASEAQDISASPNNYGAKSRAQRPERRDTAPAEGYAPPLYNEGGYSGGSAVPEPIERSDLTPVMRSDGSGLPYELWRGLDPAEIEQLIAELEIPPRSPTLHALWRRLITADIAVEGRGATERNFEALRLEALYRSGLLDAVSLEAAKSASADDPLIAAIAARAEIGRGAIDEGCARTQSFTGLSADMPKRLKGEAIVIMGYCAARSGNTAAAGLAAELARNEGLESSPSLSVLDALAAGAKPNLATPETVSLMDYRLMELGGTIDGRGLLAHADAPLLVAIANDPKSDPETRLAAAEGAAKLNAIDPTELAKFYRSGAGGEGDAARRAQLFVAAETERTPLKKTRLIRSFLDDARHAQIYTTALAMMADTAEAIRPEPELGWFAETAIEIALVAGHYGRAAEWVRATDSYDPQSAGSLDHWLALADIADSSEQRGRGGSLETVERLALRGRFNPELLHRLATVLDALDFNVPIPLWDAASSTPQPNSGHLPETGVLSRLLDASKKQEFGRTVLLVMNALGPDGPQGAHIIALGDSIRALKRAGLEADARRLGFEALFAGWPRTVSN
jgi:hypothetical protein